MSVKPSIDSIFCSAIEIESPDERRVLVKQACGDDVDLRNQVERLLHAHFHGRSILDAPVQPVATVDEPLRETAGTVIGPYKLIEQIGEGGMGTVWMAQQTEPVKRLVAIKLIKAGMDSKQVIARFEAERQALALMDHVNIARVLDGGTTSAGRPYFVMDLVKGVPITRYCDEHHLTPRQRLELFVPVCQAVQHAHQKGIIHRDLKPSNVLVALYDGQPVPKVIDFGVAKAAGQSLTDKTLVTGFGNIVGTLEYMSPEQAEVNQLDIDTRSDIYSLGVLLYELLAGSPPFSRKELTQAGMLEMLRVIREQEPSKPSTKLSTAEGLPTLAANRGTEPAKLTRLVRGELDWIVMKALEKHRCRRYETANGFAADVQRYLADEPVLACPPSAGYRLRKFARKHRGPLWAGAAIAVLLVIGIVVSTWLAVRATHAEEDARRAERAEAERAEGERLAKEQAQRERDAAERARQQEERERKYARAIADFVKNDFLALTSVEGQNRFGGTSTVQLDKNATLRQLLDRAAAKLNQRHDLDPRIEAELRWMIGVNYRAMGEAGLAIPFLERCVTLRKELFGPESEETLDAQNSLAAALQAAGKHDLAVPLYENILKVRKAKLGADHRKTLFSLNNLAGVYREVGKLDLALPLYEDAFKLRKAKLGAEHRDTVESMNSLAEGYQDAGKLDLALPLLEEALKLRKANLGADHPGTLISVNNLAGVYLAAGKLDLALPLYEDTLKRRKATLGADHPDTLLSMNNLAGIYLHAGKLDLALPLLEEAVKLQKAKLGADHPDTLTSMNNLAMTYLNARKRDLALPLLEQTLKLRKAKQGADHPETLVSLNNLAMGYATVGKSDLALPLFEESLKLRKAKLGADHPYTLTSMNSLAGAYQHAGKLDVALPLFKEAAAGVEKRRFQHVHAARIVNDLISCLERLKQFDQAEPWRRKWLAVVKERSGADSVAAVGELAALGSNLLEQQMWTSAEVALRECLTIRAKRQPDAWTTFNTQSLLGGAFLGQKKYADAEPLLLKGYEGMKQRAEKMPPRAKGTRLREALERLVQLYDATNKPEEAAKWWKELDAQRKAAENTVKPRDQ